jgi:hypothetical protein
MALTPVYLVATNKLASFLDALRNATAPEKVTVKFIEDLGFKSTNDRMFIALLKALRLVDDSGKPTKRYFEFLDDSQWKVVLANGIRDAYEDLFRVNTKANALTRADLIGKLKSLTEGKLSENVVGLMSKTFLELAKLADFSGKPESRTAEVPVVVTEPNAHAAAALPATHAKAQLHNLSYRIEIVLPAVRDQAVYDAIFRSLRDHLLVP